MSPLHLSQGLGSLGAWAGLEVGWTEVLWEFDEFTAADKQRRVSEAEEHEDFIEKETFDLLVCLLEEYEQKQKFSNFVRYF